MFKRIVFLLTTLCFTFPVLAATTIWKDIGSDATSRLFTLDTTAIAESLSGTTSNKNIAAKTANILELPLPEGGSVKLYVTEYSIMEEGADAAGFRSWKVTGVDNPAITGVIDLSSIGFHAMLLMDNGETVFISPDTLPTALSRSNSPSNRYRSVRKQDVQHEGVFQCGVHAMDQPVASKALTPQDLAYRAARGLKTYRLAIAATGEFTQFFGGSKNAAFNAIQSMVNQINPIYERDLGIHLALINNPAIIFTDPATDRYTSNVDIDLLNSNTPVLNSIIGAGNYDIGHVVTKLPPGQIGGVAVPASVCGADKGAGATGSSKPDDPTFAIDFVAHEIGHQVGATHTFNSTTISCGGGNRVPATAYEPGSGTSIMAYAGICGRNNIANNSLPVFHIASISQIDSVTRAPGDCGVNSAVNNQDPVITSAPAITINPGQGFTLTASATDPDGDQLTYSWDQFDAGQASDKFVDTGDNALFEVALPSTTPSRTFPGRANTDRKVTFQVVVRDNKGGITNQQTVVTVGTGIPGNNTGGTGNTGNGGAGGNSGGGGGGSVSFKSLLWLFLFTILVALQKTSEKRKMIKKALLTISLVIFSIQTNMSNAMPKVPDAREINAQQESKYAEKLKQMQSRDAAKDAKSAQQLGFPYLLVHYAGRSQNLLIPGLNQKDSQIAKSRCPMLILEGMGDVIYGTQHMAYRKTMTDYAAKFNVLNYKVCKRQ